MRERGGGQRLKKGRAGGGSSVRERHSAAPALLKKAATCAWVAARLPRFLWPVPKPYGHVVAFTEVGRIVADLQDPSGAYPETTAVTETTERMYVQSLHAHWLGWLPRIDLRQSEEAQEKEERTCV